jgi:hypothetical protein
MGRTDRLLSSHCRYICWHKNVLTEPLPSNGRIFWLHFSGFQLYRHTVPEEACLWRLWVPCEWYSSIIQVKPSFLEGEVSLLFSYCSILRAARPEQSFKGSLGGHIQQDLRSLLYFSKLGTQTKNIRVLRNVGRMVGRDVQLRIAWGLHDNQICWGTQGLHRESSRAISFKQSVGSPIF